ncbi:MAG TPA: tetratricopeptide repeat protein [Planctomycetaceae bacterium]|nr:tetratricopeptide repeat protein [Planctomycetaceae bacterium]
MAKVDAFYDEAIRLRDTGNLQAAADKLREILTIDPQHVLTHSALAVMLQKLNQFDDAIAHAVKVSELEPSDPFSFTQLSVIYQRCGKIQEAEDAMARARMMQMAAGGGH